MQDKVPVPSHDPQAIEQALVALRQASLSGVAQGMLAIRATALNLVTYADSRAAAERMSQWIADLAEQHPVRAIILGSEPGPTMDLETQVAAQCHPALAGRLVCFEEIQIMGSPQAEERLAALTFSLLLRDLPIVLWWPGDLPIGSPLFERLAANADRLLADSASARNPRVLLRQLVALGHAQHCECTVDDLNWDRLTPWRELTAQFFDPADCRPWLGRLFQVRIDYVAGERGGGQVTAYLLAAWLATRLGWQPASEPIEHTPHSELIHLLHGQQPVQIELVPAAARPGAAGDIQNLILQAQTAGGIAHFAIRRAAAAEAEVSTELPGREPRRRTISLPSLDPGQLLAEEMSHTGFDPSYPDALRMAAFFSAQAFAAVPFFG